jgi:branched-chain amino acid transport system ATP-binding protein
LERNSSLRLDDVVVSYGAFEAVRGVTIEVPAGAIVAVLGANGAGKTTMLRAISGTNRPRRGTIILNDQRIDRLHPYDICRRGIIHLPEGRGIFPDMTVSDNLALAALYSQRRLRRKSVLPLIDEVLEDFPTLKAKITSKAWTLSGGQQQLLAVARALVLRPRILLADELSFGLAPTMADLVFGHVSNMNKTQGTTVLMVEQNVGRALEMASYAYVLRGGKVVMADETSMLKARREELFAHMTVDG